MVHTPGDPLYGFPSRRICRHVVVGGIFPYQRAQGIGVGEIQRLAVRYGRGRIAFRQRIDQIAFGFRLVRLDRLRTDVRKLYEDLRAATEADKLRRGVRRVDAV